MASNTTYVPNDLNLDASKVQGAGQGVTATCAANTTTNIDLSITDDMIITGLEIITSNSSMGDYVVLSVMAGGVTVATPVGPWYVAQSADTVFDLVIPIKIIAGLTLRAVYHATSILVTPTVAINYKFWKVLV